MSRVSRAQRRVAFASPLELYIRTPTDSTACVSRVACEEKLSLRVHACSSSQFTLHTPASRPCAPPYAQPVDGAMLALFKPQHTRARAFEPWLWMWRRPRRSCPMP